MRPRATDSAPTKLRDSCENCASAKVKCSKEKPTCQRCRERSQKCEYGASKRHGRGPQHPENAATKSNNEGSRNISATSSKKSGDLGADSAPQIDNAGTKDVDPWLASLANFSSGVDPMQEAPGMARLASNRPFSADLTFPDIPELNTDPTSFSMPNWDIDHDIFNTAMLGWDSESSMNDIGSADGQEGRKCSIDQCCFEITLDLLRQLSVNDAMKGHRVEKEAAQSTVVSLEIVTAQHKGTLEALDTVVDCTCSLNGNLLTLLYLITFKLIARYAGAVQNARRGESHTDVVASPAAAPFTLNDLVRDSPPGFDRVLNSWRMPKDEKTRAAAQSILEDLYHIQDLGGRISQCIEGARQGGQSAGSKAEEPTRKNTTERVQVEDAMLNTAPLLSEPVASRFTTDLRQRLRAVSLEVISILLQG